MKHGYNLYKRNDRNIHLVVPICSKYTHTSTHTSPMSNIVKMSTLIYTINLKYIL